MANVAAVMPLGQATTAQSTTIDLVTTALALRIPTPSPLKVVTPPSVGSGEHSGVF